jgi:hypothetical protein
MKNQETFEEKYFKISIIGTINLLEEKTSKEITNFKTLYSKTYLELEYYRDNLIKIYNQFFNLKKSIQ